MNPWLTMIAEAWWLPWLGILALSVGLIAYRREMQDRLAEERALSAIALSLASRDVQRIANDVQRDIARFQQQLEVFEVTDPRD